MSTSLILTVPEGLNDQEKEDLRYLFTDALGEFVKGRGVSAEEYVRQRYPESGEAYKGDERAKKVEQVKRRISLANRLINPAHNMKVMETENEDSPIVKEIGHLAEELPIAQAIKLHLDQHQDKKANCIAFFDEAISALSDMRDDLAKATSMTESQVKDLYRALGEFALGITMTKEFVRDKL